MDGERIELQFEVRLRPDLRHPGLTVDIVDPKGLQLSGRRIPLFTCGGQDGILCGNSRAAAPRPPTQQTAGGAP